MKWRKALVLGGVMLGVGGLTFVGVRAGMRKRCRRKVKGALKKVPLVTDAWRDKTANKICIGASSSLVRGMRQRAGVPASGRNAVAGEVVIDATELAQQQQRERERAEVLAKADLSGLLDAAFATGADSVFVTRRSEGGYGAQISAHRHVGDRGRTVSTSATAWGDGKDATAAVRDALRRLEGGQLTEGPRRKALRGRTR